MKRSLMLTALVAVATLLSMNAMAEPDPDFHIYLCFGQSNMEGQAAIEDADCSYDERFWMMSTVDCGIRQLGKWYNALPPLSRCGKGLCPADYFGRSMLANLDEKKQVGVVVVAVGGCAIDLFDPDGWEANVKGMTDTWQIAAVNEYGGNPLGRLMDCAKQAQERGVIKGILLHQGETDAYNDTWLQKVKKIYEYMLKELNLNAKDVPLIAGETASEDQGGICSHANPTINRLPSVIPTAHVVSSAGCTLMDDKVHFNTAGQRKLGRRYAKEMLKTMGIDANIDEDEVPQIDPLLPIVITNKFNACWNKSERVGVSETGALEYHALQWGGLSYWVGYRDWSDYEKIVFEFAQPPVVHTQILVQMEDKSKDLSSKADVGARQISLSFEGKDVTRVAQVAIQADKATTLYISRVYLQRKNTSSIEVLTPVTQDSGAAYNLSGQPVHDGYQGVVVTKGKKVLKSSQ